jgi:hypothetical protein
MMLSMMPLHCRHLCWWLCGGSAGPLTHCTINTVSSAVVSWGTSRDNSRLNLLRLNTVFSLRAALSARGLGSNIATTSSTVACRRTCCDADVLSTSSTKVLSSLAKTLHVPGLAAQHRCHQVTLHAMLRVVGCAWKPQAVKFQLQVPAGNSL